MNSYFVYILTTKNNKMVYVGVTNNPERRVLEHKQKTVAGYTEKYNISKLVWFEEFSQVADALSAEKRIKGWLRSKKDTLVETKNPQWQELYPSPVSSG